MVMSDIQEEVVYQRPVSLENTVTHYCPGCTHGTAHRLVAEVLDEMGIREKTIGVASVGCSVFAYNYINTDFVQAPHGRAPAMATGVKRVMPDRFVFTYQGDGDMASIGMGEIVAAAARGENITVIFINNTNYGMTGGQMAPPPCRDRPPPPPPAATWKCRATRSARWSCSPTLDASYAVRPSLHDPKNIRMAKKAIRTAFEVQARGLSFSVVELLSICPTNWGMTDRRSTGWSGAIPYYPIGDFQGARSDRQPAFLGGG